MILKPSQQSGPNKVLIVIGALLAVLSYTQGAVADQFDPVAGITTVAIQINDATLPASDLVFNSSLVPQSSLSNPQCQALLQGQSGIISPETAFQDKQVCGVDLSQLQPDPTQDVWKPQSSAADESLDNALGINSGDTVTVLGEVGSILGRFKVNVQTPSLKTVTVMMSPTAHTILLRKELLRRLDIKFLR